MATISKKFVDLNPKFDRHPITGDLPTIKNEDAIKQAVKNIVLTIRGEKPFRPFFGASINSALFENFDPVLIDDIALSIEDALTAHEPRVEVTEVEVLDNIDTNALEVTVNYKIVGIPLDQQSLNLVLERV
jgi:phage baseplate assembly protein W